MKGMDLFCSSHASTAVISSMDHRFQVRRSPKSNVHDRRKSQPRVPCSSHFPINPKPYYDMQHKKKTTSSSDKLNDDVRRKSCDEVSDLYDNHPAAYSSSRRYFLRDDVPFIDWVSQSDQIAATAKNEDNSPAPSKDQVVVLRVSLHCKGCEGKVRKHISKMKGVTSYSIDLESKKVTIIGDVTPLGVLASVSKVKKAQFWPSSSLSSSSTPSFLWSTISSN
ncbi:protein SODIUM POTASSIUM ROOT DEFECTIVE 3-like [Prosopis cineraria]|uniref:protein SODIUM POTASSIUM ROOT DEFECTIVE 3-like n=1 Tax=Prosopis cineraria TaxID=364024 RepID=UPI00240F1D28|nr:protein SODIUM POTASSIUM ROOT DEFECTIVE 3-like [Prosopis cineraria]